MRNPVGNDLHRPTRTHCIPQGDRKGQCHSNKENLLMGFKGMKWADKIFPGFGLIWKEKRHILLFLDEKAGTGGFYEARVAPHRPGFRRQTGALSEIEQEAGRPLLPWSRPHTDGG